jgi:hypothetical protein
MYSLSGEQAMQIAAALVCGSPKRKDTNNHNPNNWGQGQHLRKEEMVLQLRTNKNTLHSCLWIRNTYGSLARLEFWTETRDLMYSKVSCANQQAHLQNFPNDRASSKIPQEGLWEAHYSRSDMFKWFAMVL